MIQPVMMHTFRLAPPAFDGTYPLKPGERAAGRKECAIRKVDREPVIIEPTGFDWTTQGPPIPSSADLDAPVDHTTEGTPRWDARRV